MLTATGLGKKYGRKWALSDCTLEVPAGRVVGLVGPNGAGKTTFLNLAVGMLTPSAGDIEVLGARPTGRDAQRAKVGFVGQDTPTYAGLSVADHLRLGAHLNPAWDAALAAERIERLGLDPAQRAGRLSGGQRAQLALTLGIAKRPELLLLDEPVASLDPLARREFLQDLMEAVAEQELSVVLSSHLVSDVERACDYLVVLVDSRVQVAGDIEHLLATHHRLTGPRRDEATRSPTDQHVVSASHTDRQSTYLVRTERPILDPAWEVSKLNLEDLVLAYMGRPAAEQAPTPDRPWRHSDDLADLATVPRPGGRGPRRARGGRGRCSRSPARSSPTCSASSGADFFDRLGTDDTKKAVFDGRDRRRRTPSRRSSASSGARRWSPASSRPGPYRLVWNQSITRTRWLGYEARGSPASAPHSPARSVWR